MERNDDAEPKGPAVALAGTQTMNRKGVWHRDTVLAHTARAVECIFINDQDCTV